VSAVRRPELARHARYRWDALRGEHQLLGPERVLVLGESAAAVARLCDGRELESLHAELEREFASVERSEVASFLDELARSGWIRDAGP
jgi:pyrroloquinoline quinone biosynthesis protein D